MATCQIAILAQTFGFTTVQGSDLKREVWLSDRDCKEVGTRHVATQSASRSNFAATKPADKGRVLAMQEEQSKSTYIGILNKVHSWPQYCYDSLVLSMVRCRSVQRRLCIDASLCRCRQLLISAASNAFLAGWYPLLWPANMSAGSYSGLHLPHPWARYMFWVNKWMKHVSWFDTSSIWGWSRASKGASLLITYTKLLCYTRRWRQLELCQGAANCMHT